VPRNKDTFGREIKAIPLGDAILESIAANGIAWLEGAVFAGEMPVGLIVLTGWAVPEGKELAQQFKAAIDKGSTDDGAPAKR
jgi:hypothetical protein